jgi:hypothetical protein
VRQFLAAPAFLFGIALLASSSAPQPRNLVAVHRRLRSALLSALAAANHARALSAPLAAAALALSASLGMAHAEEWWWQREDPFPLTPTYTEALRPPGAQSGKQLLGAPIIQLNGETGGRLDFWIAMGIWLFSPEKSAAECAALAPAREYPPGHPVPGDLGSVPL